MFADYQAQVLQAYQEKKAANLLSLDLIHPTPAKLRNECEAVIDKRFLKKDENALRSFFGEQDNATAYVKAIRKFDVDLFRPLDKFLKGGIKNTDQKNVELLAWLIDFEPRPYRVGKDIFDVEERREPVVSKEKNGGTVAAPVEREEISIPQGEKDQAIAATGSISQERMEKKLFLSKRWKAAVLVGLFVLLGGGTYLIRTHSSPGCMYWAGDHYQPIRCSEQHADMLILALDTIKAAHFKKIMRPDTITAGSLGRIWYSKINNTVEFFTDTGFHPVHVERRLKPITQHMIDTYVVHK